MNTTPTNTPTADQETPDVFVGHDLQTGRSFRLLSWAEGVRTLAMRIDPFTDWSQPVALVPATAAFTRAATLRSPADLTTWPLGELLNVYATCHRQARDDHHVGDGSRQYILEDRAELMRNEIERRFGAANDVEADL